MATETAVSPGASRSKMRALWIWFRAFPAFLALGLLFLTLRLVFSRRSLDGLLKWGCRVLVRLLGIRVRIEGLENIDADRAYTFMINHVTAIDHFVVYSVMPHSGRGLEAASNFRIPFYGWLARAIANYPVDRKHPAKAKAMLEKCARDALEQGFSVFCAPEGTRSRDGRVGPLKTGVFRLALACDREIVPIALVDLYSVLPPGEWRVRPQQVCVRVLPPIPLRDASGEPLSVGELKSRVREALAAGGLELRETR